MNKKQQRVNEIHAKDYPTMAEMNEKAILMKEIVAEKNN